MRRILSTLAVAAFIASPLIAHAQDDASRKVSNGGISVPGWKGMVDAKEAAGGMKLEDASFVKLGDGMKATTGPSITYWNPANTASGNYTVKATFTEDEYMSLNSHPHPYGLFIAGTELGTDKQSYLYCAAYGNGNFIVRGFGPEAFQMNGRGEANAAVHKAAAKGASVTQEVAMIVTSDAVQCAINGTVVGTYPKSAVVAAGKLKNTDGMYGVRFGHNTEAKIVNFTMTKQ